MQYDAQLIGTIEAALNCLRTGGDAAIVAERLDVGLRMLVAHDANAVAQRAAHVNSLINGGRVVAPRRPRRVLPEGPGSAVANVRPKEPSDTPTPPAAEVPESPEKPGLSIPRCEQCGAQMRVASKQGRTRYLKCPACGVSGKLIADGAVNKAEAAVKPDVEQPAARQ